MSYRVDDGAKCDDCGKTLTEEERERNELENIEQDGNSLWCDDCAQTHDDDYQWAFE